ncbi:MAG: phosphoribosylglycinamide formyltransferase [Bacteroidetes bacterium]|nr:phosphoribosylglycinamide formyltransferase [Bacteroidota bacterium]MCH8523696.1 phosphoribosylglycinamide formyltransferase [Balneolales bacterium]
MVLASGSGSNFQAIIEAIRSGSVQASIGALIASREGIGALKKASDASIPSHVISPRSFPEESIFAQTLLDTLKHYNPDLIVLAGYLVKLPGVVIKAYPGKIINIHPSILPSYGGKGFYGLHVHRAVIADGASESGCSIHIVTEEFDEGPVIAQSYVSVTPDDTPETLAAKVLEQEHLLLPQTIQRILHS